MRTWMSLTAVVAALALSSSFAVEPPKKSKGIFSSLKLGQPVTLKDMGAGYSLSFFEEGLQLTHTVVEIGEDYVVVRDIAGVTDTMVPVYSLKGILRMRTKLK